MGSGMQPCIKEQRMIPAKLNEAVGFRANFLLETVTSRAVKVWTLVLSAQVKLPLPTVGVRIELRMGKKPGNWSQVF